MPPMGRTKPLGVKNVITIMFSAEEPLQFRRHRQLAKADFHISYVVGHAILWITRHGVLSDIRVFAEKYAWNE